MRNINIIFKFRYNDFSPANFASFLCASFLSGDAVFLHQVVKDALIGGFDAGDLEAVLVFRRRIRARLAPHHLGIEQDARNRRDLSREVQTHAVDLIHREGSASLEFKSSRADI